MSTRSIRRRALPAPLLLTVVAVALVGAAPAAAATWNITPSTINETSQTIYDQQNAIADGNWIQQPQSSLPGGIGAGDNGNMDTYHFDAPKLDEGADSVVTYGIPDTAMPDGSAEFQAFTQDDVNGGGTDPLAVPTCVDPDPSGPQPSYSCAATFGGQPGSWPWDPSNETFDSAFHNFRENSAEAPAGYQAASVIAVGQTCGAWLSPGESATCTASQPTMDGFSPVDPNNYMLLQFINQGNEPTTVTTTNNWAEQLFQQYPDAYLFASDLDNDATPPTASCTAPGWGKVCALQTWGGANSNAVFSTSVVPFKGQQFTQVGNANSDTITISPGPGADPQPTWYGVRVYTQSEIGHTAQDGQSLAELLYGIALSYEETVGVPFLDNGDGPDGILTPAAGTAPAPAAATALPAGTSLAPGAQLRNGLYRLTMRRDGNLVQDVRVNGLNVSVWQSRTSTPGSRLVLDRSGTLAVVSRSGRRQWVAPGASAGAGPGARLALRDDGRIVLRTRGGRARFSTPPVGYPVPPKPHVASLRRGLALQPGAELRNGRSRLRMRPDGNLALYRGGRLRWSTRTKGHPGSYAHLRADGRLVVATAHGRVLWSAGRGARHLTLRRTGALTLSDRAGRAVWVASGGRRG